MRLYDIKIDEAFDSEVKGNVIRATNDLFTTAATIGNRKIVFNASAYHRGADENSDTVWEIEFTEKTPGNVTYGKTGSGNEMQVFSFVINSVKELIARYNPAEIEFGSSKADGNRSALYNKLINRIKIPGYHPADVASDTYTDVFRIIRDK
jgi:hypothetical protein